MKPSHGKSLYVMLVAIGFFACKPKATTISKTKDDSGVVRLRYNDVVQSIEKQARLFPELAKITYSSAKTIGGRNILAVTISRENLNSQGDRPVVFINEAIHGNEYLNIADRLIPRVLEGSKDAYSGFRRFLDRGGVLLMIPILNPDGYDAGQRRNLHVDQDGYGVDLNRNFDDPAFPPEGANAQPNGSLQSPEFGYGTAQQNTSMAYQNLKPRPPVFSEVETQFVRDFVRSEMAKDGGRRRLYLTMNHHCCLNYLYFPWETISGQLSPPITPALENRYNRIGAWYQSAMNVPYGAATDAEIVGSIDRYFQGQYPDSINLTFEAAFPVPIPDADQPENVRPSGQGTPVNEQGLNTVQTSRLLDLNIHTKLWDQMLGAIADGQL